MLPDFFSTIIVSLFNFINSQRRNKITDQHQEEQTKDIKTILEKLEGLESQRNKSFQKQNVILQDINKSQSRHIQDKRKQDREIDHLAVLLCSLIVCPAILFALSQECKDTLKQGRENLWLESYSSRPESYYSARERRGYHFMKWIDPVEQERKNGYFEAWELSRKPYESRNLALLAEENPLEIEFFCYGHMQKSPYGWLMWSPLILGFIVISKKAKQRTR